jgi:uronate dehydrogenase
VSTILITGAAGRIGTAMRPRMARQGRVLRLFDTAPLSPGVGPGEEAIEGSVTDPEAIAAACLGADAVIHLGAIAGEGPWDQILEVNINGTYNVFEAARRAGVPRVVFASSVHAMGYHTPDEYPLPEATVPLPDTYYGVSKVAGEALGALYAMRYGLEVISIRLLACQTAPHDVRSLSSWFSFDDCARLFEACLSAEPAGYRVVYGVSANTRGGFVSQDGARALGFEPKDDSEVFAPEMIERFGRPEPDDPILKFLGGGFCTPGSTRTR